MIWQQQHASLGAHRRVSSHHRLTVLARGANGQPRHYRLAPSSVQDIAYRRLSLAILGLDVATLASELRSARRPVFAHTAYSAIAP